MIFCFVFHSLDGDQKKKKCFKYLHDMCCFIPKNRNVSRSVLIVILLKVQGSRMWLSGRAFARGAMGRRIEREREKERERAFSRRKCFI